MTLKLHRKHTYNGAAPKQHAGRQGMLLHAVLTLRVHTSWNMAIIYTHAVSIFLKTQAWLARLKSPEKYVISC